MYEKVTFYDFGTYKSTKELETLKEQDLHIIELYLNGKLSGKETSDFEGRMKSDPEFRATVGQMRASILGIRQAVIEEKLALLKEEEAKFAEHTSSSFRITPMYRMVALAAILIAAVLIFRPLLKTDDGIKNIYLAEHFDEFIIHDTYKGFVEDSVYLQILRGYNLFAEQKFDKAIPILKNSWEIHNDTTSLFYLWVTAMSTDNTAIKKQYEDEIKMISGNKKYSKYLNDLNDNKPAN